MAIEIKVGENESIDSALNRLNKKISIEYGRRWYKKRFGYYEKPSILKRKRHRHLKRVKQSIRFQYQAYGKITGNLLLNIGLKALYEKVRNDKLNRAMNAFLNDPEYLSEITHIFENMMPINVMLTSRV